MGESAGTERKQVREDLLAAFQSALEAVGGRARVAAWLQQHPCNATHVVAIGKAAAAMVAGAVDTLGDQISAALVITKSGHGAEIDPTDPRLTCIEGAHPIADERSLKAGQALWAFFAQAPQDAEFLVCISGGASALVEVLAAGLDADFLSRCNAWLLASGLAIDDLNRIRKRISRIKAGRLAARVQGRALTCLMISDVPGDEPGTIGSGLLVEHQPCDLDVGHLRLPGWLAEVTAQAPELAAPEAFRSIRLDVVARPRDACAAAARRLRRMGYKVLVHDQVLQGDALAAGPRLVAASRDQSAMVQVQSSETTVVLPEHPGQGGRCQALALAAAEHMRTDELQVLLAAGTDGTDGPGDVAGALVDCTSVPRGQAAGLDPDRCLREADAGRFLQATGDLLRTGPTGTNVMDLILSWHAGARANGLILNSHLKFARRL